MAETEQGHAGAEATVGNLTTEEIIEQAQLAVTYLEDGARETGLRVLRRVVVRASSYWPVVHLKTGKEAPNIGSVLVEGFVRLQPTETDGTFEAPDGSLWVGCTDGVWRQA